MAMTESIEEMINIEGLRLGIDPGTSNPQVSILTITPMETDEIYIQTYLPGIYIIQYNGPCDEVDPI